MTYPAAKRTIVDRIKSRERKKGARHLVKKETYEDANIQRNQYP
jgi:hypothetical protein